jgi:hypothetical protein
MMPTAHQELETKHSTFTGVSKIVLETQRKPPPLR